MLELLILGTFCVCLLFCVLLDFSILYALVFGLILFLLYGKKIGCSWKELAITSLSGIKTVKNILFTFLLIGIIEGVLYTLISYYNILTLKIIIELILSTYMIKLILTVIYSIILMKITKKKVIG